MLTREWLRVVDFTNDFCFSAQTIAVVKVNPTRPIIGEKTHDVEPQ